MEIKPNFFIAGPPKCASGSLHFYLDQHPEILMSSEKETCFFTREYDKGIAFYEKTYFSSRSKTAMVAGEATPSYSFLPFAADRIAKHYPEAKFIFSFRHPLERAYSGWLMRMERGSETLDFVAALDANRKQSISFDSTDFESIWTKEHNDWTHQRGDIIRTYIEGSDYATIWKIFIDRFGEDSCFRLFTEDLRSDPSGELQKVYRFLGVDDTFEISEAEEQNSYRKFSNPGLMFQFNHPKIRKWKRRLPDGIRKRIKSSLTVDAPKPEMTAQDRAAGLEIFNPLVERIETLWDEELNHWKK